MNNYIRSGVLFSFVFLLINDMTFKFIAGFVTGIFISTKYDFKPYVSLVEDKIINLQKELELKREEKSQMIGQSKFNWPWSNHDKNERN